jgi:ferredoxin-type protein NapH
MYLQAQEGLMHTYREAWRSRGWVAWLIALVLTTFYLTLYFSEAFTPLATALGLRNKWYLYGALYTVCMIGGGAYYLRHHGSSRYHRVRIAVNVTVQVTLAWSLPFAMSVFGGKEYYFSYLWPLKIEFLYPSTLTSLPVYMAAYGVVASFVLLPVLTLRYGKRWYCSWICGCGALANTLGDPWRHLGDKSEASWTLEKWTIHTVLALALITTALVGWNWAWGPSVPALSAFVFEVQKAYGFVVGAILSGIVGVAVYPILGARVWCRYFCPMAAMLGLIQKLGRFRISVKEDMCISCGNCTAYCEMGIDVRAYAQKNQSFTRASCVGCGMCAHVCPRGVLKLENKGAASARLRILQ